MHGILKSYPITCLFCMPAIFPLCCSSIASSLHFCRFTSYETSDTTKNQVLSRESLPCQTSILEDKPDPKVETYVEEESTTNLHQEIVLSDDSPPESTMSFNENETGLEGRLGSSVDGPSLEEMDQSEPQEPLKSVEINEG